ncbi:hypothetical protein GGR54DRAFT_605433 [Hypoxylon sp. NC1633]|nr:hypothetical protein GGR54DRAFT_605433 [Hypoxylon sp. NC1633]
MRRWAIDLEAYRGYAHNLASTKPDLIVIKLTPGQTIAGQMPETSSRDHLWIECKAAKEDHPSGWKNVLMEAATRLQTAHPSRAIFLIVAVGWKCLYFVWDPSNAIVGQPQLFLRRANLSVGSSPRQWNIDTRNKAIGDTQWVNTVTGEITVSRAMELDCWTIAQVAPGRNRTRNWHSLATIEQFLISVQNAALLS